MLLSLLCCKMSNTNIIITDWLKLSIGQFSQYKCAMYYVVWCLWELGRCGVSTLTPQCTTPSFAPPPARAATKLWSVNTTENRISNFCFLLVNSHPPRSVWLLGGNGAKYFQSCFPPTCLIMMSVRTVEKNSELHTKFTYLWTDLTAIQLLDIVLFSSSKIKGYRWWRWRCVGF